MPGGEFYFIFRGAKVCEDLLLVSVEVITSEPPDCFNRNRQVEITITMFEAMF